MSLKTATSTENADVGVVLAEQAVERLAHLVEDLHSGRPVRDARFDRFLHPRWRIPSSMHWTPVDVCRKAALLLLPGPKEKVLDVGSGVGKFCVVGSLVTSGSFVGIEQREHLVRQAESVARQLGANRASFVQGDAFDIDWSEYQGLYFFNPFAELQFPADQSIDDYVSFNAARYQECISNTATRLRNMPAGARVVIYHTLGCKMPSSYSPLWSDWVDDAALQLWMQTGDSLMTNGSESAAA